MQSIVSEKLTRNFNGFTAVDELSFKVDEGEIFGMLGPNGAGKTTTIRMLAAILAPTSGEVYVEGYNTRSESSKVREIVGVLTENPSLYDRLTPLENLEFFARAYGVEDSTARSTKIKELLEYFDLWERRDDRVFTFSKGMKQKLALARALVHDPRIVFLDEPTSGLDPKSSRDIRALMEKLSHKESQTILLGTHRLEDAQRLCNQVMIIDKGRCLTISSPGALMLQSTSAPTIKIRLVEVSDRLIEAIRKIKQVTGVHSEGDEIVVVLEDASATPTLVKNIVNSGGIVLSVQPVESTLEDAYLKLVEAG
jgi:ABC-2 type transport system ATP-binding protein